MLRLRVLVPFLGTLTTLLFVLLGCTDSSSTGRTRAERADAGLPDKPVFDVRSVTLDARHKPDSSLLVHLRNLGVTHLTLVSFGWQRSPDDPRVRLDTSDGWYSESHRGIRTLSRQAHALGMDVILKPHIWIGGYDEGGDRSEIDFETASEWRQWEGSYRRFILSYARLADAVDADILVLGTELSSVATTRPSFWKALADTVRSVYRGRLTYAANWHTEYKEIRFWDVLDYVGVQAYFPLADGSSPPVASLQEAWRTHRRDVADVHRETGKPVLFTEVGYRSARSAAAEPWRWPERGGGVRPDSLLQARCYQAFLSTMRSVHWFAGAIIWKWHPRLRQQRPTDFTPQGKPAERVLYRWFTGTPPQVPIRASGERNQRRSPGVASGTDHRSE